MQNSIPEMKIVAACEAVQRFCAEDDGADVLWRSCGPAAVWEFAAVFPESNSGPAEFLLDLESCGRVDWPLPFCGKAVLEHLAV